MDPMPLHPKLVHLPLAIAALMPLLTTALLLAWWRDWLPKRAWLLACAAQAALVVSGVAALRTGEADGERVESVVPERVLEAHEEAAEVFLWTGGVVLALSLVALALRDPGRARVAGLVTAGGTLAVLVLGVRVGEAGGELVYRHGAATAYATPAADGAAGGAPSLRDHDDD